MFDNGVEYKTASASVTLSPERVNELRQQNIVRMIEEAGIQVADLEVIVDGELAALVKSARHNCR